MTGMRLRLLLLPALLVSACASSPEGAAQELSGCYYFERDATARELNLPWGVQLTDQPLEGWPIGQQEGVRRAVTLKGPDQTADFPFGYWQAKADSVRLGYPGMGGFLVDLAVEEQALEGTARPVGDAGVDEERPVHPVRLTLARCPGE